MNLVEFLQNLVIKGWKFWNEGEGLYYDAPSEQSTSSVLAQLKQHKAEILQLLQERPDIFNVYPLSYGQRALWFLWQLAPESHAYNVSFAVRICSVVDMTAMSMALAALMERHPILRTTYPKLGSEPIQQVHQNQELDWLQIDASSWSEEQLKAKVIAAHQILFDLETGPIMRVRWFSCSLVDHVLLVSIHHIACDRWSLDMLIHELSKLYQAQRAGVEISLPPVKHTYLDYVSWQRKILCGTQGEKLSNYWAHQLAGDLPALNLPTDRQREPIQTYNGATHKFKLSSQLTEQLKELAQRKGVTFYMILLATFKVLVYRYTTQEDILVGSPTSGRTQPEFAPIFGYFVDPVVIRTNLANNPSFNEFLTQVRQTVLSALTHQDYPFALLVENLQPHRDASRSPIFQASFALQQLQQSQDILHLLENETQKDVDWGGMKLRPFEIPQLEGQFDLDLEMVEGSSSVFGTFKYNTDLFDSATIERMAAHFQNLCSAIVQNPQLAVSELPLLSEAERDQLLVEWNDTACEYPTDKCIHQLFEEQVERTPFAVAVVFEEEQLTYLELNTRANQLAHYLQSLGVKPEVLVGICVERSIEMVVGLLGILKAGGAYVPLDPNYPQERLSYMLEDSGVQVLLTQQELLSSLPSHTARVVCLDTDWAEIEQHEEENLDAGVKSDNLAYVIYTSGSTGKPKGVAIEHHSLCNLAQAQRNLFDVQPTSRVLQFASISFDASVSEIFMAVTTGAILILAKATSLMPGEDLKQILHESCVTHVTLPPSALSVLPTDELPALGQMIVAGEACPLELVNQWSVGRRFFNAYGPTESTVCATIADLSNGFEKMTIGRPIANTQIYILDKYLQPVPIGVPGELYIGGDGLARGYLNRPQLTQEKFIPNPFNNSKSERLYKTGDLARYRSDGNIEFLGRIDNQVKIRGFRIELSEIEAVLNTHPQIEQAVVIAKEDIPGNKRLVAYVVSSDESLTIYQIREFLKQKLPEYMVPSTFVFLDTFPLTPNGKIDRNALPTPDEELTREFEFVPPRNNMEIQVAQIWSKVLNIAPVGIRDNFFEIGGNSLLAVRLMALIQQQFETNLPLATLFQSPTIEQIADILSQQTGSLSWSPLVPIRETGSKKPFFCVPGGGGNVIYFYNLARHLGSDQPFYGLQARGLDGQSKPYTRVEDMASFYIEAIQKVQPNGPYFLGGHSFGSQVAFEMGQQLQRQGHEVALVAILDLAAPVASQIPKFDPDWVSRLMSIIAIIEGWLETSLEISSEILQTLSEEEQFDYLKERLVIANVLAPETGTNQVRALVQIFDANNEAARHYLPLPHEIHSSPIVLFRAMELSKFDESNAEIQTEIESEPTMGWSDFTTQPVDIQWVPGNHLTMMNLPHVQVLAQRLKTCIEKAQNEVNYWDLNKKEEKNRV